MQSIHLFKLVIISAAVIAITGCKVGANTSNTIQPPAVIQQTTTAPAQASATTHTQNLFNPHQAIQLAEQHSKGTAVELELHQTHTNAVYDIETVQGTSKHRVQIDAKTGQLLSSYSERELDLKPKAKINLSQAIRSAENSIAGQVLEVSLDNEYLNAYYEVKILANNGHPYEVRVNASNGEITRSQVEYDD